MNSLIFYCPDNRKGKRDGDEFRREAHGLADVIGGQMVSLSGTGKRAQFDKACKAQAGAGIGRVAYFGHGTPNSLVHLYSMKSVDKMAKALYKCCSPGVTVMLYSCLAGILFGEALRDALTAVGLAGARVTGHSAKGHTTRLPDVVTWPNADPAGWLVDPRDKQLWRAWREVLKTDFRFRFPWMHQENIERYLRGEHIPPGPSSLIPERP